MKIEVLGTGCPKCRRLAANAAEAVAALGLDAKVEKVEPLREILARGVMLTPALLVDGRVQTAGRVPDAGEIARLLAAAAEPGA